MTALHQAKRTSSYIFSSESVSDGHPDKVCDQISDAILDAYLAQDPQSRVACETLATEDLVILSGEINSKAVVDIEPLVRGVIEKIGYTHPGKGFDHNCRIQNLLQQQSSELASNEGAGDQGLMFGYACSQTKSLMPIPIELSHLLLKNLATARKEGLIPGLLPDAKSQVGFRFDGRIVQSLKSLVISTHHQIFDDKAFKEMQDSIIEKVVNPTLDEMKEEVDFDSSDIKIQINPLGKWHNGGPAADTGLTGRKIIVDTYGGWASHGGGAFSGKDPSKVDRSAAYMARHIAKSVVASGLAEECLLQFSFIIGEMSPISIMVDSYGTGVMPDSEIEKLIRKEFDLTVKGMIEYLGLKRAIYFPTAAYGHFGANAQSQSWEKIKKLSF